jgi:hypothetical protein
MNRSLLRLIRVAALVSILPPPVSAQPAGTPAPNPPVVNRVNEYLPSWLYVRGEFRERMEGVTNAAFTDGRDDVYWLSRFRFDVTARPSRHASFSVQVQDARAASKEVGPTAAPFSGAFDLRMAYAQIGDPLAGAAAVRVGRQELAFGEQRLVGHVSWLNTARTFDGARLTVRRGTLQVDAFATSVVRIQRDEFDKSGNGNGFFGAYVAASDVIPRSAFEPYVFWRRDRGLTTEDGTPGSLDAATVGLRIAGRVGSSTDYGVEVAVQRGSLGSDDVRAWAGHWQVRSGLPGPGRIRLLTEYNYASGDADPADGRRGTFDQLYPTPHDKYGLADQVGWKNVHHVRVGLDLAPWVRWPMNVGYHTWWLAESRDALYTAGSVSLARIAAGAGSRHVGQEVDVQVSRAITPQLQLAAGYAYIVAGQFLEQATPGASYSAPFVMATYIFLADK